MYYVALISSCLAHKRGTKSSDLPEVIMLSSGPLKPSRREASLASLDATRLHLSIIYLATSFDLVGFEQREKEFGRSCLDRSHHCKATLDDGWTNACEAEVLTHLFTPSSSAASLMLDCRGIDHEMSLSYRKPTCFIFIISNKPVNILNSSSCL